MTDLKIKTLSLGELNTNCYIIWNKETLKAWVIDPADSGDLISEEILRENLKLEKIILTHGHFDHILGLLEVKLNFPHVPIYLHQKDLFLVKSVQGRVTYWLKRQVDPVPLPDKYLQDGDTLILSEKNFKIIETPGHTPGSICLYCQEENLLISGDTLFKHAIGRTDFKYSDHEKIKESLKQLIKLPSKTTFLPGHGEKSNILNEVNWIKTIV